MEPGLASQHRQLLGHRSDGNFAAVLTDVDPGPSRVGVALELLLPEILHPFIVSGLHCDYILKCCRLLVSPSILAHNQ